MSEGIPNVQMDSSRIFGGVEARCVALHPCQPVVAVVRLISLHLNDCSGQDVTNRKVPWHFQAITLEPKAASDEPVAFLQAALGIYANFDIYSGCKLGSAEVAGTALSMVYSSDGTQLYVLTAVSSHHLVSQ